MNCAKENPQLETMLKKSDFVCEAGKGSHRKWRHPLGGLFVMSGKTEQDAKHYQEREVVEIIARIKIEINEIKKNQKGNEPIR